MSHIDRPISFSALSFSIAGLHCAACVARVENALTALPQVQSAAVNLSTQKATIQTIAPIPLATISEQIEKTGFSILQKTVSLSISGASCAACALRIENALLQTNGVIHAAINLATQKVSITCLPDIDEHTLSSAIAKAGYAATTPEHIEAQAPPSADQRLWLPFAISGFLTAFLTVPMVGDLFGLHWHLSPWLQFLIASVVQFVFGARFYRSGWKAIRAKSANMDVLVAVGTSSAYGLSAYLLLSHTGSAPLHLYFESSAAIITLVLFGQWLEHGAKNRTLSALHGLAALRPATAMVRRQHIEIEVPVSSVALGDIVVIRPYEHVPVDGVIIEGESDIDTSLVTGESLPVSKTKGDAVIGGTLNQGGLLAIQVTAVGEHTMLAHIIRLVEEAQAEKAPIQRLVDRVSSIFVPVVLLISVATFFAWLAINGDWEHALLCAVAVQVIACPCALGLATPTAILVGTGVAARHGILIKNADILESARNLKTVVFDKTGTLTEGHPVLTARIPISASEEDLLTYAWAAQMYSDHPLATAVKTAAQSAELVPPTPNSPSIIAGKGVQATWNENTIYLGNSRLMDTVALSVEAHAHLAQPWEETGHTIAWLATVKDGHAVLRGLLIFGDALRSRAPEAVARLHALGLNTCMLTGDHLGAAKLVASKVGITQFHANLLPDEKLTVVSQLKAHGNVVAMVGDGVNDAPALATADIGIAMSSGTDIAMHSAGITLMRNDPAMVADAIDISQRTYRKIQQNLGWAFIYNLIGIPLAAAGLLNPVIAATAMALSSTSVILNALLLQGWKPR